MKAVLCFCAGTNPASNNWSKTWLVASERHWMLDNFVVHSLPLVNPQEAFEVFGDVYHRHWLRPGPLRTCHCLYITSFQQWTVEWRGMRCLDIFWQISLHFSLPPLAAPQLAWGLSVPKWCRSPYISSAKFISIFCVLCFSGKLSGCLPHIVVALGRNSYQCLFRSDPDQMQGHPNLLTPNLGVAIMYLSKRWYSTLAWCFLLFGARQPRLATKFPMSVVAVDWRVGGNYALAVPPSWHGVGRADFAESPGKDIEKHHETRWSTKFDDRFDEWIQVMKKTQENQVC